MKQAEVFMEGEGRAWLDRNVGKLTGESDPVIEAINKYQIKPESILEIGCANGWRLELLRKKFWCIAWGVDPGANPSFHKNILRGTADRTGAGTECFDTVIYGWCLYLCDPEDYFRIVMEGDRVLRDGGYLIIHDFCTDHPYKLPYKHKSGVYSHHYDFSRLWLSHPGYYLYGQTVQDETCVTILQKKMKTAFPVEK